VGSVDGRRDRDADRRELARRRRRRRRRILAGLALLPLAAALGILAPGLVLGDDTDTAATTPHDRSPSPPPPVLSGSAGPTPTRGRVVPPARPRNIYTGILPGHLSPAVRGVPERVYVPNSDSGTVTEIDPVTFAVLRTFATGSYDQHITPSWNLRRLYVNNTTSNTLTVLSPRTGRPIRTIPVADPYNLYFTPDGSKAIVVAEGLQRLDFRNPHTWRLIRSLPIPAPGPDHLDFTADGHAFLISCEFAGMVYRVDARTMRVTGRLAVGGLPVDIKLSPDGRRFYVANQGPRAGVTMISAHTLRILGFIHTGYGAHGLAISRNTRDLYVANRLAGTISVVSFARRRVVATWHVGGSPDMLQVSPDGRELWASNRFNGTVSVIDTRTGRLIHTIVVGSSPHGLAYFPQPGAHSLGHNGVYR
jgi:YVTN family beta-propeller protein